MSGRIEARFAALAEEKRAAFIPFIAAGDPDLATFENILAGLPAAGADVIEVGMPFSDPMADGPTIQKANIRALAGGITLTDTLAAIARFRQTDAATPVILMGYYNPIYHMGVEAFARAAAEAGVDGLIVVDLPPEEADELLDVIGPAGLRLIFLATPTTSEARRGRVLAKASGFVYYVAIAGITGTAQADAQAVGAAVTGLKSGTDLPVAVGFGIKTPDQAAAIAQVADGVVVGSAIVSVIEASETAGENRAALPAKVLDFAAALAGGVHGVAKA